MRNDAEQSPYQLLAHSAPLLVLRGFVIAGLQFFAKRAIYAKADESFSAAYAVFSAIEGFIFILVFRGFRIISANAAHLHAREIVAQHNESVTFDPAEIGILYRQGVLFGCVLLIPSGLLCLSSPVIFRLTKQSDIVLKNCAGYFSYGFLGYAADMVYRSRARIDIGRSQPAFALLGDIVEGAIDVVGTYILVNGKWGFPNMGVNGGSLAYAIAAIVTALGYHFCLSLYSQSEKYKLYRFTLYECKNTFFSPEFKKIVYGGLHIAFRFSILNIVLMLTTFFCSVSGTGALIGLQAAGAYGYLVSLPISGFSEAASVLVGRLVKTNWDEARTIGNVALLINFVFSSFCAVLLFMYLNSMARIFVNNDALHTDDFQTVKTFLCVQAVMEIINSLGNTGASILSGCLKTRRAFLLALCFNLILNSVLSSIVYFASNRQAGSMYAVQLIGSLLNSSGILLSWKQQKNPQANNTALQSVAYQTNQSIWEKPALESPRNSAVNEYLNATL